MSSDPWGRVDETGTVYVRTADGEQVVGSWQAGSPEEALAYFERKYEGLVVEIGLLEKRVKTTDLSAKDAQTAIDHLREQVDAHHAVGDLDALRTRLDKLVELVEKRREERKVQRAKQSDEARAAKEALVAEAEELARSDQWRSAGERLRSLVDTWKGLPRLDRKSDDELWHRFSHARSAFSKRRKQHFAQLDAQREEARKAKERLVAEAESLSGSTDWGPTAARYRDLMTEWKKAGSAPRNVEDKLWKKFRAAQDAFFTARDEANALLDAEYEVNAEKKLVILAEAEKLLPIKDPDAARKAWLDIADRWEAAGKVPRAKMNEFESKIRKVEDAVRAATENKWKRTDPEKSARADDMITKLEKAIDDAKAEIAKAEAAGDAKKLKAAQENLASRESFLEMAQKAQADFS